MPDERIFVAHARVIGMTCCGDLVPVTAETTQTNASPQALPLITLENKPLKIKKVTMTNATIVAPAQVAALKTFMIVKIATASQLLVTARAKIIMPNQMTTHGNTLWPLKL